MNLIESIQRIMKQALQKGQPRDEGAGKESEPSPGVSDPKRLQEILDGMGTGTARMVIDREASRKIAEEYNLQGLKNKGRYYVAKVVRPDGTVIDELLVDKQTGSIQFLGRRI